MIDPVNDPPQPPRTRGRTLNFPGLLYDLLVPIMVFGMESRVNRRTARALDLASSDVVLDLGCATGNLSYEIARRLSATAGGQCIGIDASPQMVARARRKIRGRPVRFDIGLAEKLPYADGVFTKAASSLLFHHLDMELKRAALAELRRVVAPGGLVVIADMDRPTTLIGRLFGHGGERFLCQHEIEENLSGVLPDLFAQAGFSDIRRLAHDYGYVTTFSMRA